MKHLKSYKTFEEIDPFTLATGLIGAAGIIGYKALDKYGPKYIEKRRTKKAIKHIQQNKKLSDKKSEIEECLYDLIDNCAYNDQKKYDLTLYYSFLFKKTYTENWKDRLSEIKARVKEIDPKINFYYKIIDPSQQIYSAWINLIFSYKKFNKNLINQIIINAEKYYDDDGHDGEEEEEM